MGEAAVLDQESLIAEIESAFAGVTRDGGVSWSESVVIDDYGSEAQRAEERAKDLDADWRQLVDDPKWVPDRGVGGWSFLDPIGFRYYLPAAMIRSIRSGYNEGIEFHLTLRDDLADWRVGWLATLMLWPILVAIKVAGRHIDWEEYKLTKWSALDAAQSTSVKHFLEYMDALSAHDDPEVPAGFHGWRRALDQYWGRF